MTFSEVGIQTNFGALISNFLGLAQACRRYQFGTGYKKPFKTPISLTKW